MFKEEEEEEVSPNRCLFKMIWWINCCQKWYIKGNRDARKQKIHWDTLGKVTLRAARTNTSWTTFFFL